MTDPKDGAPRRGPVLIDLDEDAAQPPRAPRTSPGGEQDTPGSANPGAEPLNPATAPAVPDTADGPYGPTAFQHAATLAARPRSALGRFFWAAFSALLGFVLSIAAWRFAADLMARAPLLGWIATALIGALLLALLGLALRELIALSRLRRIDTTRIAAEHALATGVLSDARAATAQVVSLYAAREDLRWGRDRFATRREDVFDAEGLLHLAEAELLAPLDKAALREVEGAARQVATVTAVVPLALADVATALTANLGMIRRIAEIYGGRSGTLGSWRLTRAVMAHLVATGAVAVGDDLIGSVAGGNILSKLSRRFGEGIVNGALTARVGVAAMEVCRPLPFHGTPRPSVVRVVQRALTGLFGRD